MSAIGDIRRQARRDLHSHARVPALFIASPSADPVPISVRAHTKLDLLSAFSGGQSGLAGWQDEIPRIVFDRNELASKSLEPKRSVIVTTNEAGGEGYRIDNMMPSDGEFIIGNVTRLTEAEMTGLPVPEA